MRTCTVSPPEPFTWACYGHYLDLALANGYSFATFDEALGRAVSAEDRVLLWRHDIDYDVQAALPIARLEQKRGIRATYFFQVRCLYYTLENPESAAVVREVLSAGHALGLHFDATQMPGDDDVLAGAEQAARALEECFGTKVAAVSFHMPTHRPVRHLNLRKQRINTYGPVFFDRIAYVSDSNQDWRGKDLADVLTRERPRALQVLTHPEWWGRKFRPFLLILRELASRLRLDLEADILTPEQRTLLTQPSHAAALFGTVKG